MSDGQNAQAQPDTKTPWLAVEVAELKVPFDTAVEALVAFTVVVWLTWVMRSTLVVPSWLFAR